MGPLRALAGGVAVVVAALVVPGVAYGQLASSPWPMFGHDLQHTGRSALAGPAGTGTDWTFATTGTPGSPALGADGTIYITGSPDTTAMAPLRGVLHAVNPTGSQAWAFELPGWPASSAPAVASDGTIYVHLNGEGGNVAAVETLQAVNSNGTSKWTYEFNDGNGIFTSSVQSSPAIAADGRVWAASIDTFLYALDPDDGSVSCDVQSPTVSSMASSPAIATDGTVYVVDSATTLHAFEPDCDFKWSFQLSSSPVGTANDQSAAVGPDGTIYIGSPADEKLYAVNPNGTLRCSFQTGSQIGSTPAIGADGTVYVGGDGLYALTPNCVKLWKFPTTSVLFSSASPVVGSDGTIYWRESFTAYAVNSDGTQKWSLAVDPSGSSGNEPSAAIGPDRVLYLADGGFVGPTRLRAIADRTPPQTTIDSGPSGATADPTPSFAFSASEPGSSFECRVDGAAFADCDSPHTAALADGTHTFAVRATDASGNTDPTPASRAFTVDAAPPETTIDSGPSGTSADPTPSFTFSAGEASSSFQCRVDAGTFADCGSPYTAAPLADGAHSFQVRARDQAGNVDPTPASQAFTIDTVPDGGGSSGGGGGAGGFSISLDPEQRLAAVLARGLRTRVTCPRACRVRAALLLARRTARRLGLARAAPVVVGRASARLRRAGTRSVTVRLTTRVRRRLRRARRVRLTLRARIADARKARTFRRRVTLSRPAAGNRPPAFPSPLVSSTETKFDYDDAGLLVGAVTTITIESPPRDPDRDRLSYAWRASNGSIRGSGLRATWTRAIDGGRPKPGKVTVTASDRRGGSTKFSFEFR